MDFFLALLILAFALVVLAFPLYRARAQTLTVNASTLDDLLAQRDGVYATLRDLEQDKELGKLDAADYDALREKYMVRAAEILHELDMLRGEGDAQSASAEIEAEVTALRKRAPSLKTPQPVPVPAPVRSSDLFCTNCGRQYKPGDKFCARCGHPLS
jgi:hypothetical protein